MWCQFNVPLFGINEKERLEIFQSGKHQRIIIVTKIASHDNTRTRLRYGILKFVCYLLPLLSVELLLKYVSGIFFTTRSQQSPTDHQKRIKKKKIRKGDWRVARNGLEGLEGGGVWKMIWRPAYGMDSRSHAATEKHYLFRAAPNSDQCNFNPHLYLSQGSLILT